MTRGFELEGRYREDPIGSEGKSLSRRKHRLDGTSYTPTEQRTKDGLMRQFCKQVEGVYLRDVAAYTSSPVWCPFCSGRRMRMAEGKSCAPCARAALEAARLPPNGAPHD